MAKTSVDAGGVIGTGSSNRNAGTAAKSEVNVSAVIDAGSLNRYQIGVFFLCGLFLIMDGFDVQSMGYVAPALITDWKIQRETVTPVLLSGLAGLFIGFGRETGD